MPPDAVKRIADANRGKKRTKEQIENSKQHLEAMEKQIEYFRFSYNKQLEIHEKLIDTFRERNFIEAKEKGLDKS